MPWSCTTYTSCLQRTEAGVKSPGTGVEGSLLLLCECWEPIPGPLKEQSTLLTAELSLQRSELSWITLSVGVSRANPHDTGGWLSKFLPSYMGHRWWGLLSGFVLPGDPGPNSSPGTSINPTLEQARKALQCQRSAKPSM